MKKYYYFLLLLLLTPAFSKAQVHNAENFNVGDEIHYMVCTPPDSFAYGGMAVIWDFHAVQDSGNGQHTTWVLADTTPASGNIILSPTPVLNAAGSKVHKTSTQSTLVMAAAPPAISTYNAGVLLIDRNLTYGLMDSNSYTSTVTALTNTLTGAGTSKIEVDGSGTLKTPAGTFNNVLRVKRTSDNIDSIPGNTIRNYQVSYLWYDSSHTAPLFRVDSLYRVGTGFLANVSDTSSTSQYLQALFPAGLNNLNNNSIQAATAHLDDKGIVLNAKLETGAAYVISVFTINGQAVYSNTFTAQAGLQHINLNRVLPAGNYVITVSGINKQDAPTVIRVAKE
ncbi:MAG: T9SS type A sorting domain-containing protein [Bacteroidetes bacterium]|nr:T9SS type A sorting domain-containing protein [Bacteroidota bacterium]